MSTPQMKPISAQMIGMASRSVTMPPLKPCSGLCPGPALEFAGMRTNLVEESATVDTQQVIRPSPNTTCPATKCSAPVPLWM